LSAQGARPPSKKEKVAASVALIRSSGLDFPDFRLREIRLQTVIDCRIAMEPMKAFVFRRYGLPDVLELKEMPVPVPAPGEVLIRVRATTINDYDWAMVTGKPYAYRLLFGLFIFIF